MSNKFVHNYKKIAIRSAKLAGRYLLKEFKKPNSHFNYKPPHQCIGGGGKGKTELVTQADKKAEKIIVQQIRNSFFGHQILSEETGRINDSSKSPYLWLIDPIDGTTNFVLRSPLFAISIALAYNNEIILGVIYAPVTNELYVAEKQKGAYLNGRKLKVSSRNKIGRSFLVTGYSAKEKDQQLMAKLYPRIVKKSEHHRDFGSAALELAYVAAGRIDGAVLVGPRPFDVAAGVPLIQEAGGQVTNFRGQNWTLKDKYLTASNGLIHQELLKILTK